MVSADWDVCRRGVGACNRYDRLPFPSRPVHKRPNLFDPDRRSPMFTTATNFFARHAFVVMPKAARKPSPPPQMQFSYPLPYGAILRDGGVQFVVYSRSAT